MPIIEVKNIGKKYNISHRQGGYLTLRDVLTNVFKNPFRFLQRKVKAVAGIGKTEEFWALKDVSFNVEKGEVVGIIGANGAGKSTLLKILSQITPPTEGEIKINGRVGSLLEVGTGFHPELTGRENIFLNGAILGMRREEIAQKFDEIVEFSGVEKFLDTPVKYYSSGMYVRLAFSVAAHMEPDVLVIDEVLAVGDAEFQKKCLGKMDKITREEGRTILFVSHNMGAIQSLCKRCFLLKNGEIVKSGATKEVIEFYMQDKFSNNKNPVYREHKIYGDIPYIESVRMFDKNNELRNNFTADETMKVELMINNSNNINHFHALWHLSDVYGKQLAIGASFPMDSVVYTEKNNKIICELSPKSLVPGKYVLGFVLFFYNRKIYDNWSDTIVFEISDNIVNGKFNYPGPWEASLYLEHKWLN